MEANQSPVGHFLCVPLRTFCLVIGYFCLISAILLPIAPYFNAMFEDETDPLIYEPTFIVLMLTQSIRVTIVSCVLLYGVYKDNASAVLSWIDIGIYWIIYRLVYDPVDMMTSDGTSKDKLLAFLVICFMTVIGAAATFYVHRYYTLMTKPIN